MRLSRAEQRRRAKERKWELYDKKGVPGRRNEFGHLDLTPHEATRAIVGRS